MSIDTYFTETLAKNLIDLGYARKETYQKAIYDDVSLELIGSVSIESLVFNCFAGEYFFESIKQENGETFYWYAGSNGSWNILYEIKKLVSAGLINDSCYGTDHDNEYKWTINGWKAIGE